MNRTIARTIGRKILSEKCTGERERERGNERSEPVISSMKQKGVCIHKIFMPSRKIKKRLKN